MTPRYLTALVLLIPLWGTPLGAQAREPATEPITLWRIELAQVQRRLEAIQEKVLQDPEMARLDSLLGAEVAAAMAEHDPSLHAAMEDVDGLTARLEEAEAQGDETASRAIEAALDEIDERFARARMAALREPALADRVEVFNEALRLRMVEESRDAAQLFTRLERLSASLARVEASH